MRIKISLLFITVFFIALNLGAQQLAPQVLPTQGIDYISGGMGLSLTVGEPFSATFTGSNRILTQGFEQPIIPFAPIPPTSQTVCSDTAYTFTYTNVTAGSGGNEIQWATNSNFTGSHIIISPGSFSLTVNAGATDTIWLRSVDSTEGTASVSVFTTARTDVLSISISTTVNADSVTTLTASGGTTYVWSNTITTASDTVSVPGLYFVTVTDAGDCTALGGAFVTAKLPDTARVTQLKFNIAISPSYNLTLDTTDAEALSDLKAKNSTANSVLSGMAIDSFHSGSPKSDYEYLRNMFILICDSSTSNLSAILSLNSSDSADFPYVKEIISATMLSDTPNDYHGVSGADCSVQLDYIDAIDAWNITTGNPNITIGINELTQANPNQNGYDTTNPDLKGQVIGSTGNLYPNCIFHGTAVLGCAAAHTNNGIGVAAIGYNSSLYFYNAGTDNASLWLSEQGYRVINCSWGSCDPSSTYNPSTPDRINSEVFYDEIYENGTTACFGGGNGFSDWCGVFVYGYPNCLDHNISVGPVGYANPVGDSIYFSQANVTLPFNWKDCHEECPGEPTGQYGIVDYSANDRISLCAPSYNVISTYYNSTDTSDHYSGVYGTSFASPIVAGTVALMLDAKPCLSPYQIEYLLKTTARNIDTVMYNGVNLNAAYVGKMGFGALDAGVAVTAASALDCNDFNTQTMYVQGININTICVPGYSSNSINPQFTVLVAGGTPPYTYRWDPLPFNNATLSSDTVGNPAVVSTFMGNLVYFRLGVYDHSSPVPKVASALIKVDLTTAQTPKLVLRDSYMDMLNEPDSLAIVDGKISTIWQSPDVWNRLSNDGITTHQNPVYDSTYPNFAYARVRNVGCTASSGHDSLYLYWALASTGEEWDSDWTTATLNGYPAGGVITSTGIHIQSLEPGDTLVRYAEWLPPNPKNYNDSATNIDACFLGRIQTSDTPPYGMTYPEVTSVKQNIINNNKIATRNMVVTNDTGQIVGGSGINWHEILFENPDSIDHQFSLEITPEKAINKHFSGDLSAYIQVSVGLGVLYDRWITSGGLGVNTSATNRSTKTMNFTGERILLQGITIHAHEKIPSLVGIQFLAQPTYDQYFHIRQWTQPLSTYAKIPDGNITFLVQGSDTSGRYLRSDIFPPNNMDTISPNTISPHFKLYPNPTTGNVLLIYEGSESNTISYIVTDITGEVLIKQSGISVSTGSENIIDLSLYEEGIYFIYIIDKNNTVTIQKLIKGK